MLFDIVALLPINVPVSYYTIPINNSTSRYDKKSPTETLCSILDIVLIIQFLPILDFAFTTA